MDEISAVSQEDLKRAWWHVGRFFHSFAILEGSANELFDKLFSLNGTFFLLLVRRLGINERLELKRRKDMEVKGLFLPIGDLIEVRNIVAHSGFGPDDVGQDNVGPRKYGVNFDYVGSAGKVEFSERVQTLVGCEPGKSFIPYDAFEDLDSRNGAIKITLMEIGWCLHSVVGRSFRR